MSEDPFKFLKGEDNQFDSAMKSIDSMYNNVFKDQKLDKIFETFKVENNKILQPIDHMHQQIFNSKPKHGKEPTYIKVERQLNEAKKNGYNGGHFEQEDEDDFVIGDPVYGQPQAGYNGSKHYKGNYFGGNNGL